MAKKATPAPVPALDSLPASALEHPTLHAIVQARVRGKTQRDIADKHGLELSVVRAVLKKYLG